jgi:hypothetical protein
LSWSLARPSRACWFPRRDVAIVAFPPTHGYSALARRLTACRVSLWSLPGSPDLSLARPTPGLLASPTRSPSSFGQLTVVVGHRPPSLLVCSSTLEAGCISGCLSTCSCNPGLSGGTFYSITFLLSFSFRLAAELSGTKRPSGVCCTTPKGFATFQVTSGPKPSVL